MAASIFKTAHTAGWRLPILAQWLVCWALSSAQHCSTIGWSLLSSAQPLDGWRSLRYLEENSPGNGSWPPQVHISQTWDGSKMIKMDGATWWSKCYLQKLSCTRPSLLKSWLFYYFHSLSWCSWWDSYSQVEKCAIVTFLGWIKKYVYTSSKTSEPFTELIFVTTQGVQQAHGGVCSHLW